MPQNAFFSQNCNLLVSQKTMQRHFFSTLHPLSPVIFATATVVAFVLLRNSVIHNMKQRLLRNRPGSDAATSHNFLRERLQRAFTRANQLHWTAHKYNFINYMLYTLCALFQVFCRWCCLCPSCCGWAFWWLLWSPLRALPLSQVSNLGNTCLLCHLFSCWAANSGVQSAVASFGVLLL